MRSVNQKVYTKKYYLSDCTGYKEYITSYGDKLEPRLQKIANLIEIEKNTKVLDIGCGRGELVLFCAKKGIDAYGVDYSTNAIYLANKIKERQIKKINLKMHFIKMNAKKLKFNNNFFDQIILTDVLEHLYPEELELMFTNIKKILKPQGKIIVHTAPNKLFNDIGYKYYSYPVSTLLVAIWNIIAGKKYPNIAKPGELRTDSHAIMHINEPTYFTIKKICKKYNLKGKIISSNITAVKDELSIKDKIFNFIVFFHPLSKSFPLNIFFGSDFLFKLTNIK